jgi:hypothetical protein
MDDQSLTKLKALLTLLKSADVEYFEGFGIKATLKPGVPCPPVAETTETKPAEPVTDDELLFWSAN